MIHSPEHSQPPQSAARRVLIVEDDRRLREMLVASINEMGLSPTAAPSAEAALRLARAAMPFAIAVVDLTLPGIDGLDFCEQLRHGGAATELIILTGFGDLTAAQRAIRLGVVDFLTKPCGMDELERALTQARLRWLDRWYHDVSAAPEPQPPADEATPASSSEPSIDEAEKQLILAALAHHKGNRELAAAQVGISVRKLYYRLKQYQHRDGGHEHEETHDRDGE